MCGGSLLRCRNSRLLGGLSPRVRGKRYAGSVLPGAERSIPACAGEAVGANVIDDAGQVYPRVCGGSGRVNDGRPGRNGLSPRVRGKLAGGVFLGGRHRSIPACAGEARCGGQRYCADAVYPRVCGGSRISMVVRHWGDGLSPRVRGKPAACRQSRGRGRSIPACAGEAPMRCSPAPGFRVYPRVCGGSSPGQSWMNAGGGLSPRVRGKPPARIGPGRLIGSIPACAGEATANTARITGRAVYPRVCGGSRRAADPERHRQGLSPRVRGKPGCGVGETGRHRSIPACAGEAPARYTGHSGLAVYPRVCGGSPSPAPAADPALGLSPRVRGKQGYRLDVNNILRSIPACAGEAWCWIPFRPPWAVYPRVCGGSWGRRRHSRLRGGLSPRVRGKLRKCRQR